MHEGPDGESTFGRYIESDRDLVVDTNLQGPYLCIRAMLDLLRASDGADQN